MTEQWAELVERIKKQKKPNRVFLKDEQDQLALWRDWAQYQDCVHDAIMLNRQRKLEHLLNPESIAHAAIFKLAFYRWRSFNDDQEHIYFPVQG